MTKVTIKRFLIFILFSLFLTSHSTPCEAVQKAGEFRAKAKQAYKMKKYLEAAQWYENAADAGKEDSVFSSRGVESETLHKQYLRDLKTAGALYTRVLQYDKAITLFQKALTFTRQNKLHAESIQYLMEIALCYRVLKNPDESIKSYEEAFSLAQQEHLDIEAANIQFLLGILFFDLSRYSEALKHLNESFAINQRLGQARENEVANNLYNMGRVYLWQGHYADALKYFEDALSLHQKLDEKFRVALDLNDIGLTFSRLGQYEKALASLEKALEASRKLASTDQIAYALQNTGDVYMAWGRYENAMKKYQEALEIIKTTRYEDKTADILVSIGQLHFHLKQYNKALPYFEQALVLNTKLKRENCVADNKSTIGVIYSIGKGQHDKALQNIEEALVIAKKLSLDASEAVYLGDMGRVYFGRGQYDKASLMFRNASGLYRKTGDNMSLNTTLYNLGRALYAMHDYSGATPVFSEAVDGIEKIRKFSHGAARRDYIAKQIASYQYLASSYIRTGDFAKAVHSLEQSRAKFLAEQIAGSDTGIAIPTARDVQNMLPDGTVVLMYGNINLGDKAMMVVTRQEVFGLEFHNKIFYESKWSKNHETVTTSIANARGVKIVPRDAKQVSYELKPGCSCDAIINYYRTLLANSGSSMRGIVVKERREAASYDDEIKELARILYDLLVKPIEDRINGAKELIIVTDGALGFLPFETLRDGNGRYLAETYRIRYVQSMGVMDLLSQRKYDQNRKPLLAFGGAIYDQTSYYPASSGGLTAPAQQAMQNFGRQRWSNLPGTLKEVNAIAAIVPGAKICTGSSVTKQNVQRLSTNGELSRYKVIHFATHGMVVPAVPERSAVVLGGDDRYLWMAEISALKLKADFVNLSACETGLGKLYEGEGIVGLSHAFLIAGTNGLSVSLWQVADESTAEFMAGMYGLAYTRGLSYAQAIAEMKRKFIRGDYGLTYRAPYYWAPFVYYGL